MLVRGASYLWTRTHGSTSTIIRNVDRLHWRDLSKVPFEWSAMGHRPKMTTCNLPNAHCGGLHFEESSKNELWKSLDFCMQVLLRGWILLKLPMKYIFTIKWCMKVRHINPWRCNIFSSSSSQLKWVPLLISQTFGWISSHLDDLQTSRSSRRAICEQNWGTQKQAMIH